MQATDKTNGSPNILRTIILVVSACLIHGIMQGVHDNYGIMMRGLIDYTNIS